LETLPSLLGNRDQEKRQTNFIDQLKERLEQKMDDCSDENFADIKIYHWSEIQDTFKGADIFLGNGFSINITRP